MAVLFYDYEFTTPAICALWDCTLNKRFETMELFYRKRLSIKRVLNYFRKAFKITPATLKNSMEDRYYEDKILALWLLTHYSNEEFKTLAKEFHISLQTLQLVYANQSYKIIFDDKIKSFFKIFEDEYLLEKKAFLAQYDVS